MVRADPLQERIRCSARSNCPDSRVPTDADLALIEGAGPIALIAIERQRSQESLKTALDEIRGSEAKLGRVIDTIPALTWCNLPDVQDPDGTPIYVNRLYSTTPGSPLKM